MLMDQLKEMANFTNHEKDIASYVLDHLEEIPQLTSDELAKLSFTSKATVIRLCQKLDLSGYQEFKLKLVAEINQEERINRLLANEPITDQSTPSDIMKTLPFLYDKSITNTRLTINENTMNRINNRLKTMDEIHLYGTGISYMLAQSAAYKFSTLGVPCSSFESINGHALAARKKERIVVFLISFTGANKTIHQIAQYLKEATDYYIVGIMGPHSQGIERWCDEIIEIPNRDSLLSLDVIHSFSSANYVLDIIFGMLLAERYENHVLSSVEMLNHQSLLLDKLDN